LAVKTEEAAMLKSKTCFEQVPVETVKKIAEVDATEKSEEAKAIKKHNDRKVILKSKSVRKGAENHVS
jgi:hypothetical protein